ncbi:putative MFS general substrate transporter [Rosellinia necatrix]|uniref:Putative MFS general substrate transporter n=1 Tax=Rosellinia necatrix TaxID=77044 RepID=A0A1W2TPD2_ROSNE|nr:putative MFS general substrate transporter [Rosellinia necatrix]
MTGRNSTSQPTDILPTSAEGTTSRGTERPKSAVDRLRFWAIMLSLSLLGFISALDTTIIPPALPTIIKDIGGATQYIWIANVFVFASSALQPLFGQISDIAGRRAPTVVSIALFIIGSGLAGGSTSAALLIAGRGIQGIGAGGIYVLIDIICCDLVPLRERGKYLAIVQAWGGVAAALGPVIGGTLADRNWRWIFYINIPICALPLVAVILFMAVKTGDGAMKLKDVDFLGNLLFIPSTTAVLFGLVTGGSEYPWSSWRVILPLVLGVVGWIVFLIQQYFAAYPSLPLRLFSNRTSAAGYGLNFLSSVLLQTIGYFLPVYFQAVISTTVSASGVAFLPITIGTLLFASLAGILLSKYGSYRPLHAGGFIACLVGCGLFTLLDQNTHTVAWVFFEITIAIGLGTTVSTILPAILAALSERDVASASAAFAFLRSFGFSWGVTIASVLFNTTVNKNLSTVSLEFQNMLKDGKAYSFASQGHRLSTVVDETEWNQIVGIYVRSLRSVWWFALGVSAVSFLLVGFEKGLRLSTELNTQYGLQQKPSNS